MTGEIPCNLKGRPGRPAVSSQQAGGSDDTNEAEPLSEYELAASRELESSAMAGPWRVCGDGDCECRMIWSGPEDCPVAVALSYKNDIYTCREGRTEESSRANARFIAYARTNIPRLHATVAAQAAKIKELEAALRREINSMEGHV